MKEFSASNAAAMITKWSSGSRRIVRISRINTSTGKKDRPTFGKIPIETIMMGNLVIPARAQGVKDAIRGF